MTDFITEMMETAGVEWYDRYYRCTDSPLVIYCKNDCDCCDKSKEVFCFPDFTAAKQLEVIKLIGFNSSFSFVINEFDCRPTGEDKYRLTFSEHRGFKIFQSYNPSFTQALAQLTTELMNAGELDKNSVKNILED